jgi:PAS domain S-box-containing protein
MTTNGETVQFAGRVRIGKSPVESKLETTIADDAASLESILCTEEVLNRPWRQPDYEKENSALVALVSALADSPRTILQTLADKVRELLHADSAGLSLLTKDEKRFYWAAIAGAWRPHIGGGTPRDFGPCGDVLDRNIPMLFTHWERRYPYLKMAIPLAEEGLLVPFYVDRKAVGTIWAIAHSNRHKFDAEDLRLLESMGRFASAAYQAAESVEELKLEIAARERAETAMRELTNVLECKIRRLVDSNIIGIFIWAKDGRIIDANEAYLRIIGYDRGDLIAGRLNWRELTPPEWHEADDNRGAQLEATGTAQPYEKEYFRKDGRRAPVLIGAAVFEGSSAEGVGFVLDLTDRKKAERAYAQVQMELAHANRVATMGQLSASIAHEISQPIGAVLSYANAASHWLDAQPPNLEEVRRDLGLITESGILASEVIDRIRALVKKAPPRKDRLEINEAILEVIALTKNEMANNGISVRTQLAETLPTIQGDRVQLQQVILNLLINAIEAMSGMSEEPRELLISTRDTETDGVLVAVRDSGPGIAPESVDRLFESFYTTKPTGLGMGLSICRSIIEAHQGRLWASANTPRGTVFQFTLPPVTESVASAVQQPAELTFSAKLLAGGQASAPRPQGGKNPDKQPTAANRRLCYSPDWTKQSAVTMSAHRSYNPRGAHERAQRAEITRRLRAYYASIFAIPVPNSLNALIERRSTLETCAPGEHAAGGSLS